jgi:hypothetical protein
MTEVDPAKRRAYEDRVAASEPSLEDSDQEAPDPQRNAA